MTNLKPCIMKSRTSVKGHGFHTQTVLISKVADAMAAMILMTTNFMDLTIDSPTFKH